VIWHFDFVSPFSYIGLHRLRELGAGTEVRFHPVLFAGLLEHWGQKGPAEIPVKRRYTYRWCTWWAQNHGIPFRFPAAHPFNPLRHLRLAIAAGATHDSVTRIFDALWTTGADPADEARFERLRAALGVDAARLTAPEVKEALRRNTEEAAARGVFGVPTFEVQGEIFWGADSIEFLNAFLADPVALHNEEVRRVDSLPIGAARRTR
jgi:2-hydroxychromene-2-carboxylate isomerase